MQYLLFDDDQRGNFLPLTYTRPVSHLRVGIEKVFEKWARTLQAPVGNVAADYLAQHFNDFQPGEAILINGRLLPHNPDYSKMLEELGPNEFLQDAEGQVLFARLDTSKIPSGALLNHGKLEEIGLKGISAPETGHLFLKQVTDLYRLNRTCIEHDFNVITAGRKSEKVADRFTAVYGEDNIFIEPGAKIRAAVLNAEDGPIYIGKNVDIQEGAMVHSAHAFCENAVLNMGAKLRGDTTIGPWSKVGGEVANSVITGYSNKGHEGYLGNSVLGEWCNLGADTNTSNLKNNYANVRVWNYETERFADTGLMFCGLIMGDHSKCGINTMFNTGTVVGVSANIFGSGYPRNFIPSFAWGGASGFTTYALRKAFQVAEVVMGRRKKELTEADKSILTTVSERTAKYRKWEKKD